MPLYACYCPDYTAEGTIDKRLKVREGHLKRAEEDKREGRSGELMASAENTLAAIGLLVSSPCLCSMARVKRVGIARIARQRFVDV